MNNLAIWIRLIGLSAAWGMAFLFIRIAVPALGPIWLVEMRVLIAGCILLAWIMYRGQHLRLRQHALLYLKLGALNSAFPFMLVAWGEIELTASLSAVLIATTPLFTAVLVSSQSGRALGWARAAGLILGLCGVIVLTGGVVTLAVTPNHLFAVFGPTCGGALLRLGRNLHSAYEPEYPTIALGNRKSVRCSADFGCIIALGSNSVSTECGCCPGGVCLGNVF